MKTLSLYGTTSSAGGSGEYRRVMPSVQVIDLSQLVVFH